tara:strand:+ start:506 stop:802 length:297 start_codon:yes stop_codon:yes gene_type:complete
MKKLEVINYIETPFSVEKLKEHTDLKEKGYTHSKNDISKKNIIFVKNKHIMGKFLIALGNKIISLQCVIKQRWNNLMLVLMFDIKGKPCSANCKCKNK